MNKDNKEINEKERLRQELIDKEEKERKYREAQREVQQHFDESFRYAQQKVE
jgi:hypothetical protein